MALLLAAIVQGSAAAQDASNSPELQGLSAEQSLQLRVAERTLVNLSSDITAEERRDAARLLLSIPAQPAIDVLTRGLGSGREPVLRAVLEAMETAIEPPEELLEAAVLALQDAPPSLWDALGRAIGRFGEAGLRRVATSARDASLPSRMRLGAIHSLSWIPTPQAAEHLVSLLQPDAEEPQEIVEAACQSLQRLTNIQLGRDPQRWLDWWKRSKNKPRNEWIIDWASTLQDRVNDLKAEILREQTARDQLAQRLVEAYRELFLVIPKPQQTARLAAMLGDDQAAVREFAFSRVDQRLRDGEAISDELQQKLIERLDDQVPRFRAKAAGQLDKAGNATVSHLVAQRLPSQSDAEVINQFLGVLASRPIVSGLDVILARLEPDAPLEHVDAACAALWAMIEKQMVPQDQQPAILADLRLIHQRMPGPPSPPLARVLIAVGEQSEFELLEPLLESAEPATSAAAAQGFAHRDQVRPLLAHARLATVYPHALAAVSRQPAELSHFQSLLSLHDGPPASREQWRQAVRSFAGRLTPGQLLAADDALAACPEVDTSLRLESLSRIADAPPESMSAPTRTESLIRLIELLQSANQPGRAAEFLARLDPPSVTPEQAAICFRAAAGAGQFDRAAQFDPAPASWLKLLEETISRNSVAAAALRDEIRRRFEPLFDEPLKAEFQRLVAMLDSQQPSD